MYIQKKKRNEITVKDQKSGNADPKAIQVFGQETGLGLRREEKKVSYHLEEAKTPLELKFCLDVLTKIQPFAGYPERKTWFTDMEKHPWNMETYQQLKAQIRISLWVLYRGEELIGMELLQHGIQHPVYTEETFTAILAFWLNAQYFRKTSLRILLSWPQACRAILEKTSIPSEKSCISYVTHPRQANLMEKLGWRKRRFEMEIL